MSKHAMSPPSILWQIKRFSELTATELYTLLALRMQVFIVEQVCPYQDIDGLDVLPETRHVCGYQDSELVAYLRVMAPTANHAATAIAHHMGISQHAVIGRVLIASTARGTGLSHTLIEQAINICETCWPDSAQFLSAQAHLTDLYQQHGFHVQGEVYLEDNIPHIDMIRPQGQTTH